MDTSDYIVIAESLSAALVVAERNGYYEEVYENTYRPIVDHFVKIDENFSMTTFSYHTAIGMGDYKRNSVNDND